jgi:GxxExxY protein
MDENVISKHVVDSAYHIHVKLGPGLLESVYQRILKYELEKRGLQVEKEVGVSFAYDELTFDEGFRADLIANRKVILEIKSVEHTHPVHKKQLLTYLKLTSLKLGLLINFGAATIKEGITRIVNGLEDGTQVSPSRKDAKEDKS